MAKEKIEVIGNICGRNEDDAVFELGEYYVLRDSREQLRRVGLLPETPERSTEERVKQVEREQEHWASKRAPEYYTREGYYGSLAHLRRTSKGDVTFGEAMVDESEDGRLSVHRAPPQKRAVDFGDLPSRVVID